MKLVFFCHQFFPRHLGGSEVYTLELARAAKRAGYDVAVVTYVESSANMPQEFVVEETQYQDIPLYEINYNLSCAPDPARYEYDNPHIGAQITELLLKLEPDLVHVIHAMKLSAAALAACRRVGVPYLVTLCDFWFICPRHSLLTHQEKCCSGPRFRSSCAACLQTTHGYPRTRKIDASGMLLEMQALLHQRSAEPFWSDLQTIRRRNQYLREQLLGAQRIFALSRFQKEMFVRNGYPAERIELLEHGVALPARSCRQRAADMPLEAIFIGSLVPIKGVQVLLEALALIPHAKVRLRIYGELLPDSAYVKRLRALAEHDPRVEFCGTFAPERMSDVLAAADLLLVPSLWYENGPLVVKAAIAAGVPVLASRLGSLPEMIEVFGPEYLLAPGDVAGWAARIAALAESSASATDRFRKLASSARPKSIEENTEELLRVYRDELDRKAGYPLPAEANT